MLITAAIVFDGCATSNTESSSSSASEAGWERVTVTRNADDVNSMTRVGDVSTTAKMVFGSPDGLRKTATIRLQKEAAKKGASLVLIQKDDFQPTPINNVSLLGVAYK